jgi:membrane fusion protein, multidrug efflux system
MKRNQLVLIGVFVLISALIFFRIVSNKKEPVKELKEASTVQFVPVADVKNQLRNLQLISYGQITPNTELDISFEVQGKLEKGDLRLKPGVKFKMNQLLYKVNEEEAFFTLGSRKSQLSNLIIGAMPDIELDFPSEKNKWMQFLDQLGPERRLPELPAMRNAREKMFITSKGILSEYYAIRSQESRMEKYYYVAPFSGTVLEVYAEPGSIVNPGGKIARVARTGEMEVKVPISLATIKKFKEIGAAAFTDASGKQVGKGKIIRISDVINQKTQSVDVYYSISAVDNEMIYNGQFVNVAIDQMAAQESFAIPRAAVKDNKVNILVKNKLVSRQILVVGNKPDTLFVSGLNNGEQVLLELIDAASEVKTFKGIKR